MSAILHHRFFHFNDAPGLNVGTAGGSESVNSSPASRFSALLLLREKKKTEKNRQLPNITESAGGSSSSSASPAAASSLVPATFPWKRSAPRTRRLPKRLRRCSRSREQPGASDNSSSQHFKWDLLFIYLFIAPTPPTHHHHPSSLRVNGIKTGLCISAGRSNICAGEEFYWLYFSAISQLQIAGPPPLPPPPRFIYLFLYFPASPRLWLPWWERACCCQSC